MKKYTFLLFLSICYQGYAQHTGGIKLGFNTSSYGNSDMFNNMVVNYAVRSFKPQFGVYYTYDISERSQLLVEAQYVMRGTDYQVKRTPNDELSTSLRLWYLEVPFSYQVKIRKSRFSFHAGAYFGILTKKDKSARNLSYLGLSDGNTVYKDKFSPISLGLQGGVSYNLKHISFAYRLSTGLITEATFGNNFSNKSKNTASHNLYIYIPIIRK